jgi:ABC-type multidrug transport system ATPase subunit
VKNILEAEGIIKEINGRTIISDCYLKCTTGEIIGLFGRNGQGKSLLLKIIFGTESAYNKVVRINNVIYSTPYQKPGLIAYLPQKHFLPANLKVCEIVNMTINAPKMRAAILNYELIKDHLGKKVRDLSGGQQRILEVLLMGGLDVKFLLLDEPLAGIDPIQNEQVLSFILSQRTDKGIIMTDHNYELFFDHCDQKKQLANGVCSNVTSCDELCKQANFL